VQGERAEKTGHWNNEIMITDNFAKILPRGEVMRSQAEVICRIGDLIARHNEVLASYAHPRLADIYYSYFKRVGLPALQRGARIRTIYTDTVYSDATGIGFIRDTVRAGCEARTVTYLPAANHPASMIIGEHVAVFAVSGGDSGCCCWSIHHGDDRVAAHLGCLEDLWRTAAPVEADPSASGLTPMERRILRQLCRGAKDESAARMLGISVRTYRRHVTALCIRLGASSRFEAGVNAAHAGLVRPGY
jgi:DNA-binding CsgD family transcriptional regulator